MTRKIAFSLWHGAIPVRSTMAEILFDVSEQYDVSPSALVGRSRAKRIVHPRQDAMARMADAGKTYSAIGRFLGGRDHSTIMHGVKMHRARMALCLQGGGR